MFKYIKNNFFWILLYIFLIIWILWSWDLVLRELIIWNICPKLLWIPACIIIFIFFVVLFVLHILKIDKKYFYYVVSIPLGIALYATIFNILWSVECPKTEWGIPMCYISLFLFTGLLDCKIVCCRKLK